MKIKQVHKRRGYVDYCECGLLKDGFEPYCTECRRLIKGESNENNN